MKKSFIFIVCLILLFAPAHAKKNKKTKKHMEQLQTKEKSYEIIADDWLNIKILTSDKEKIIKYYQEHSQQHSKEKKGKKKKGLPPGLKKKAAKGKDLPPGWEKKIARGEVLDLEVYKRAEPIPGELIKILPPLQKGTILIKVEGKIIRLMQATKTILDVFELGW